MIKIYSQEKDFSNKNNFNWFLNKISEGEAVTLAGRLFHARATISWNEQSTIVQSHLHLQHNQCQ